MDDAEITAYLIEHLSHADDPNDLILDICQKTGRPWQEVEAFVKSVQEEHLNEIITRQSPLLTILALGTFTGGIILTAFGIYPILIAFTSLSKAGLDGLLHSPEFYMVVSTMAQAGLSPFVAMFFGLGMILGSLLGMREVWVAIIERYRVRK